VAESGRRRDRGRVAFISIHKLKDSGGLEIYQLISALHNSIKACLMDNYNDVHVLSALSGAVIIVPDGLNVDFLPLLMLINNNLDLKGIPIRVGLSYGDIQELKDIDDQNNYIGKPINVAARLANSPKNSGLLVHDTMADRMQTVLYANHWLSVRNLDHKPIEVEGKREEKFTCICPPESVWVHRSEIEYKFSDEKKLTLRDAAAIAFDLPNFSDGDLNELSQRFRGLVDIFQMGVLQQNISLEYFYFSPGGDGGVFVFADLSNAQALRFSEEFSKSLKIESEKRTQFLKKQLP